MTELARRRRALMAKTASGPVIPSGYVTNGLVFFLDALQGINGSTWTDIAGQKAFTLTDCVNSGNGIVFNGTSSKGVYNGSISSDWNNETIEAAISSSVKTTKDILCQPFQNASVGISLRLVRVNDNYQAAGTNLNASENSFFYFSHGSKLISVNRDRCVANKEQKTANNGAVCSLSVVLFMVRMVTNSPLFDYVSF